MGFYHQLEFDDTVLAYKTQPFSFTYELDGKTRRYTPDVLVKYIDGHFESWEVKPEIKASEPKFIKKFARLKEVFKSDIGHPIRLVTCETIEKGHTVANLRDLYRFKFEIVPSHILERVVSALSANQQYKVSELHLLFQQLNLPLSSIKLLIAHGYFNFDFSKKLNESTTLKFKGA